MNQPNYKEKLCVKCDTLFVPKSGHACLCQICKTVNCIECGKIFIDSSPHHNTRRRSYCSWTCRSQHRFKKLRQTIFCDNCGVISQRSPSRIESHMFCNRSCRETFRWKNNEDSSRRIDAIRRSPDMHSDRRREQLNIARTLRKPLSEERKATLRLMLLNINMPIKHTSIEIIVKKWLDEMFIYYEEQKLMFNRWKPDFILPEYKITIQADGDYWHNLPHAIQNDAVFDYVAKGRGWIVLRFLGSEIEIKPENCMTRIFEAIEQREAEWEIAV